jgi:hypothetical protein
VALICVLMGGIESADASPDELPQQAGTASLSPVLPRRRQAGFCISVRPRPKHDPARPIAPDTNGNTLRSADDDPTVPVIELPRARIAPLDQLGCPKQPTGVREERAANALLKSSETAQDKASRLRRPRYRTSTSSAGAGGDNKIRAAKAGTRVLPFTLIASHLQSYIHLTRDRASVSP